MIRIGREIQCLPYAGIFIEELVLPVHSMTTVCFGYVTNDQNVLISYSRSKKRIEKVVFIPNNQPPFLLNTQAGRQWKLGTLKIAGLQVFIP